MLPLWFLTAFLGVFVVVVVFYFKYFSIKRRFNDTSSLPVQQKVNAIKKISPPSHAKGWNLVMVDNGLRVWKKTMGSSSSWYSGIVYGCSGVIPASFQDIMEAIQDLTCITEWDPCVQKVSKVSVSSRQDVISITPVASSGIVENIALELMEIYGSDTNAIYSRYWRTHEDIDGWVFTSSMQQPFASSGFLWCTILVKFLDTDHTSEPECLVTMVTAPVNSGASVASGKLLVSDRIAGLKDYFTNVIMNRSSKPTQSSTNVQSSTEEIQAVDGQDLSYAEPDEEEFILKPYQEQEVGEFTQVLMSHTENKMTNDARIKQILKLSMNAYNSTIGTDGWTLVGNMKDVEITKRQALPGEKPFDTLKGVGLVNVPVHYLLAYAYNLKYRGEWDDLFLRGEVVDHVNSLTRIAWMEYKAVWPTSGRDFVNLVAMREVGESLYVIAAAAGECANCPPKKGLVRAEILTGSFFVKEVSSDPPCCQVTYITRVDLKGNLPLRLVNRVTQTQPQAVSVLRDKLEAIYNEEKELAPDKEDMTEIQKEGVDLCVELMKMRELRQSGSALGTPKLQKAKNSPNTRRRLLKTVDSLEYDSTSEERSSVSEVASEKEDMKETNLETSGAEVNEENMQLPFVDRHHIDYKTLGNQAAATLVGEVILASKAEISVSEDPSQNSRKEGEWSYQSIERDVVILRKVNVGEKIHSFLGRGMIKSSPLNVWNAVKNHMTRHVYDKTLKKTKIVKQLDENSKILYLHMEAAQCFLKQARDFLILTTERIEPEKFVVVGLSVEAPECPPVKELVRGKVYASGWVIEPVLQDGQLYSMVSYLSQVDFGGVYPTRLVNYIARRQPLCIAFLREYLEKFKE